MSEKVRKCIDIIQWIMIIGLIALCVTMYFVGDCSHDDVDIAKKDTYIKIHKSQTIEALKKKNKELYDSITALNESGREAESAVQIVYRYKVKTDTITRSQFIYAEDSIYHYVNDNDTVRTEIDIKAKDLAWCKTNTEIKDKFTIINRTDGTTNETSISHSGNVEIEKVDAWRKKKTFKDRITIGPTVGVGYGVINRKVDVYVGFSVGIKLN